MHFRFSQEIGASTEYGNSALSCGISSRAPEAEASLPGCRSSRACRRTRSRSPCRTRPLSSGARDPSRYPEAASEGVTMAAAHRGRSAGKLHCFHESRGIERHRRANRFLQPPKHSHHRRVVVIAQRASRGRDERARQKSGQRQRSAGGAQFFSAGGSKGRLRNEGFHRRA
jgi:hypothetical protein